MGRGSVSLFLGGVGSLLVQGVGAILVARLLGVTRYGLYTLSLVPTGLFITFTMIGVSGAVTRFVSYHARRGEEHLARSITASGFILSAAVHLAVAALVIVLSPFLVVELVHTRSLVVYSELAATTIPAQGIMNFMTGAFNGRFMNTYTAVVLFSQAVVKTAASLALILLGFGIAGAIYGFVLSYYASILVGLLFLTRVGFSRPTSFAADVKKILRYGSPGYLANIIRGGAVQGQLILIQAFSGAAEVGAFSALSNLASLLYAITNPVSSTSFQAFSELSAKHDGGRFSRAYPTAVLVNVILLAPFVFIFVFFAHQFVQVLYDHGYESYYYVLGIISLGFLSVDLGSYAQQSFLSGVNRPGGAALLGMVGSAALFGLTLALAPFFGIAGASLATTLSFILPALFGHIYFIRRRFGLSIPTGKILRSNFAAALAAALAFAIAPHGFVRSWLGVGQVVLFSVLAIGAYTVLLPLFSGVTEEELLLIRSSLGNIVVVSGVWSVVEKLARKSIALRRKIARV